MGCAWKVAGDVDDVWGGHRQCPGRRESTAGTLALEPDGLGACSSPMWAAFGLDDPDVAL